MIFTLLIGGMLGITNWLISLVPVIPDPSSQIVSIGDSLIGQVGYAGSLLSYIYTPTLYGLIFVLLILFLAFDWWWALSWWVLRKIPVVGKLVDK